MKAVDTNALPDYMPLVSNILAVSGNTLQDVRAALKERGVSDYGVYLTVKGAAMCYPHVAQVLQEESIPDTQPG